VGVSPECLERSDNPTARSSTGKRLFENLAKIRGAGGGANGVQVRSVGFLVNPRVRALYPDKNDPELMRIGGLEDWQIQTVWTPGSVLALRLSLLMSFALTFGIANMAIGAVARVNKRKT
jgi:hypothetical protein